MWRAAYLNESYAHYGKKKVSKILPLYYINPGDPAHALNISIGD